MTTLIETVRTRAELPEEVLHVTRVVVSGVRQRSEIVDLLLRVTGERDYPAFDGEGDAGPGLAAISAEC